MHDVQAKVRMISISRPGITFTYNLYVAFVLERLFEQLTKWRKFEWNIVMVDYTKMSIFLAFSRHQLGLVLG